MHDAVPPTISIYRSSLFRLALVSLIVVAGFAWLACYLMGYGSDPQEKLGLKIGELLVQAILLVAAGGIFVQSYNRWQSKRAAINEFRKATLHSLIKAYSDTKKSRRTLRARLEPCMDEESQDAIEVISCSAYDEYMNAINDTQLSLEVVKRELRVFKAAFANAGSLIECVRTMENYLGRIIDEYEKTLKLFHGKPSIPLSRLPRLNAFMVKGAASDFTIFSEAFHQSLEVIQLERVKVG